MDFHHQVAVHAGRTKKVSTVALPALTYIFVTETTSPAGGGITQKTIKEREHLHKEAPDRFEFVFTPKHGPWLNLIESFFRKMTHQMLRRIRVKSKEELEQRIYAYFVEVNDVPVVYHWK